MHGPLPAKCKVAIEKLAVWRQPENRITDPLIILLTENIFRSRKRLDEDHVEIGPGPASLRDALEPEEIGKVGDAELQNLVPVGPAQDRGGIPNRAPELGGELVTIPVGENRYLFSDVSRGGDAEAFHPAHFTRPEGKEHREISRLVRAQMIQIKACGRDE